jgi:hypothetical protein
MVKHWVLSGLLGILICIALEAGCGWCWYSYWVWKSKRKHEKAALAENEARRKRRESKASIGSEREDIDSAHIPSPPNEEIPLSLQAKKRNSAMLLTLNEEDIGAPISVLEQVKETVSKVLSPSNEEDKGYVLDQVKDRVSKVLHLPDEEDIGAPASVMDLVDEKRVSTVLGLDSENEDDSPVDSIQSTREEINRYLSVTDKISSVVIDENEEFRC